MATLAWRDAKTCDHLSQKAGDSLGLKWVHNVIEVQYRCTNPLRRRVISQWILEKCVLKVWNGSYWPMTNILNISDDPISLSEAKFSFTGRSFTFFFLRICKQSRQLTHTHSAAVQEKLSGCRMDGTWSSMVGEMWSGAANLPAAHLKSIQRRTNVAAARHSQVAVQSPTGSHGPVLTELHDLRRPSSLAAGSRQIVWPVTGQRIVSIILLLDPTLSQWGNENCALLGYYASSSGDSLWTIRDNLSTYRSAEDGTDKLSRNVGRELPLLAA